MGLLEQEQRNYEEANDKLSTWSKQSISKDLQRILNQDESDSGFNTARVTESHNSKPFNFATFN